MIENFPVSLAYFVRRETWPGWKIEPRTIPNHELVLVLSGRGEARIKGRIHPLGTGSFPYVPPGLLHDMKTDDSDCLVFYAVHFDTDSALPELPHCFRLQNSRRLEHARGLLLGTDWSVEQVASCCGYEDPFYFSRCFRKEFGLSPRKYRQANPVE